MRAFPSFYMAEVGFSHVTKYRNKLNVEFLGDLKLKLSIFIQLSIFKPNTANLAKNTKHIHLIG